MRPSVIKNALIGEIPPTPNTSDVDDSLTPIATATLIEVARSFGTPISYEQEQKGRLIQNILPVKNFESKQISTSSETELLLHTETAFHPYKPEIILLMCLRGDEEAFTTYAHVDSFIESLGTDVVNVLQQPRFVTSLDESFINEKQRDMELVICPLRKDHNGNWELTFDYSLMRGTDDEAAACLYLLKDKIMKSVKSICLEAGDILVVDNKSTVHGRSIFHPRYDGTDRWLKRILVTKQMPPRQHIDGHMVKTRFGNA